MTTPSADATGAAGPIPPASGPGPAPTPAAGPRAPDRLLRFDRAERNVHWWTAALVGVCLATAAGLYLAPVAVLVGRRNLVRDIHVLAGLALPLPYLVGRLGRWGAALRADARRLSRFDDDDLRWLRSWGRDPWVRNGKFNAGQKLNAAFVAGAGLLLLGTGAVMRWFSPFPLAWRTGATFVHDWTAFAVVVVLVGHVAKALGEPEALRGMVRGTVSRRWAGRRAPRWAAEHPPAPDA